jgi:3-deoxy-D-manno-octulosonic-acid transferase
LSLYILFPFSRKPRRMIKGYWVVGRILRQQLERDREYIWFHAASLGEFEQGRPLIERIRERYPEYRILLTFFSPSGYEVRKHYQGADIVCYLPPDTRLNAYRLVHYVRPRMAFFIKYEFWKNYLDELHRMNIPIYSVSSVFRRQQVFFKWYGSLYRAVLKDFTHLFVQNETSKRFLAKIGVPEATVVGDTRFDRVLAIKEEAVSLPHIETFRQSATRCLIAGSSWPQDEDLFIDYFNRHPEVKLIIAPHEINDLHLTEIIDKLKRPYMQYSRLKLAQIAQVDCLIIDSFGLLSSIYRYGDVAYIGGGFGEGIHNLLEAAVYGIPVVFAPNHSKFIEADQLMETGGGYCIHDQSEMDELLDHFFADAAFLRASGKAAGDYVVHNSGATERILQSLSL